jgi:hypothetical protein
MEDVFDRLDKNRDGVLTPREIIMGLRRHPDLAEEMGLEARVSEGKSRDKLMEVFAEMDKNQDDEVSREEFVEHLGGKLMGAGKMLAGGEGGVEVAAIAGAASSAVSVASASASVEFLLDDSEAVNIQRAQGGVARSAPAPLRKGPGSPPPRPALPLSECHAVLSQRLSLATARLRACGEDKVEGEARKIEALARAMQAVGQIKD